MWFVCMGILLITFGILWYWDRRERMNIFKRLGILGPRPNIFLGNIYEFGTKGFHRCLFDWKNEYGKTYGYFEGPLPIIVTSDVKILKTVFVKRFENFHSRKKLPFYADGDPYNHMFVARGDAWRRLRLIAGPSFTTKRMMEMSALVNRVSDNLMDVMHNHSEEAKPFNIYSVFQRMSLDVIGRAAFGVEVNSLRDPKHEFNINCRRILAAWEELHGKLKITIPLSIIFPDIVNFIRENIYVYFFEFPRDWIHDLAKRMILARQRSEEKWVDFLQLMIDQEVVEAEENDGDLMMIMENTAPPTRNNTTTDNRSQHQGHYQPNKGKQTKKALKGMTLEEMQGQCLLFLLAGYETTSTSLAFTAYHLALNPPVQIKLQEEIDQCFPQRTQELELDYLSIQNLPYMDMVFSEVLRLHSIGAVAVTRQCVEACVIEGVKIPAGMVVQANMEAVHKDIELWGPEDPNLFVPERFSPDRKSSRDSMAWLPFGAGPRNCIGMRFAFLEAKINLIKILRQYSIKKCEQTQIPLPVTKNSVHSPSEGVYVVLEPRL